MPLGVSLAFCAHGARVGGYNFYAHRSVDRFADGEDGFFKRFTLFGYQGWIGGDPVENAQRSSLANLVNIGSINKKFHKFCPNCVLRTDVTTASSQKSTNNLLLCIMARVFSCR